MFTACYDYNFLLSCAHALCTQEELYKVQREKETCPKSRYDLSWRLKKSEKLKKSLSLPHIHTVRPVASAGSSDGVNIEVKAFDSPKVPIKKQYLQLNVDDDKGNSAQINAITNKLNEIAISRYMRRNNLAVNGSSVTRKVNRRGAFKTREFNTINLICSPAFLFSAICSTSHSPPLENHISAHTTCSLCSN